jgi:hypothetical protein
MFINNRVIFSDNGVLEDLSAILSDPHAGKKQLAIVAAEDALFIGSDLPFNHRFLMLSAKNVVAGTVSVSIWTGSAWVACEDIQDFSSVAGVPFACSGLLRFDIPIDSGWGKAAASADVTGLATTKIKNCYWAKITFSAAFDFELEYVGFRFAKDSDLNTYYKDLLLPQVMKDFNSGVAMPNWDRVHVVAAEEIIEKLRKEEIIISPNQVLDPETFTNSACHKLAEMAYSQFGESRLSKLEFAQGKYKESMAKRVFNVDKTGDGRLQSYERMVNGSLRRC